MHPATLQKKIQEWFEEHGKMFKVFPWPPNSPDINPFEHLWDVLDQQIHGPHNMALTTCNLLMSWVPDITGFMESLHQNCSGSMKGDLRYYVAALFGNHTQPTLESNSNNPLQALHWSDYTMANWDLGTLICLKAFLHQA